MNVRAFVVFLVIQTYPPLKNYTLIKNLGLITSVRLIINLLVRDVSWIRDNTMDLFVSPRANPRTCQITHRRRKFKEIVTKSRIGF